MATTLAKGAYLAVSGDFSIIESGCALEVDIGGELRVWYFTGETDVFGGSLSGSASGEVACIMSVRGKLSVEVERLPEGEGARVSGFVLMMSTTITFASVPSSLGSFGSLLGLNGVSARPVGAGGHVGGAKVGATPLAPKSSSIT
ncbi:MAG: hypothetical protein OSB75_08325 [Dehalococcoidia bacterium]|nr:hypothetical protein [Dehalococcoidia bacterium]